MDVQNYLNKMNEIRNILLEYIDEEADDQGKFQNLIDIFKTNKIQGNKHLLASTIHLLSSIIDNHYRKIYFFNKIFNIILFFKEELAKYFTNFEIYDFFRNNKRVILFFIEEKIINLDLLIVSKIIKSQSTKYYLLPEIKSFFKEKDICFITVPDDIKEIRKTGFSDDYILQLIEKDSIEEFIEYINKKNIDLNEGIETSIFETNFFITKNYDRFFKSVKLIEYSAFFGSLKIFKYLITQKCQIESKIWLFAIHGRNPEIIHIIEEINDIKLNEKLLKKCLKFSIECHHNELTNYLLNNYACDEDYSLFVFKQSLKYYNFDFIQHQLINSDIFYDLCRNGYFVLVNSILQTDKNIDINKRNLKVDNDDDDKSIKKEKTALFSACEKGYFEIVQLLLNQENIDVNKKSFIVINKNESELTSLYAALTKGNMKIVHSLLNHKCIDINLKSFFGKEQQTPLFTAINFEYIEIIRFLINRNDIDINLESSKIISEFNYDDNYQDDTYEFYKKITPLYQSVECENHEIIKLLLENKNIDVNIKSNIIFYNESDFEKEYPYYMEDTALYRAVVMKKTEIARLLLSHKKIDVSIKSKIKEVEKTVLHAAVQKEMPEIVKLLIEFKNIDINNAMLINRSENPEIDILDEERIKSEKSEVVNRIKESSYLSFTSTCSYIEEKTALFMAIEKENVEIVQLLIKHENIDINKKSFNKSFHFSLDRMLKGEENKEWAEMTPLYLAVEKENSKIVQLLVKHKNIKINMKSIHYLYSYTGLVDISFGISRVEEDKEETALHNAVSKGNLPIIKAILSNKNVNKNITNKQGKKPIDLTKKREIKKLLI